MKFRNKEERFLIEVIASVLHKKTISKIPKDISLKRVYQLAKIHYVDYIFFEGIKRYKKEIDASLYAHCERQAYINLAKDINQKKEYLLIKKKLEENRIDHFPLKGFILKDLYPASVMRQMSDIDIFIDLEKQEKVKEIMNSIGYTCEVYGVSAHDIYYKKPFMNVEIHNQLFQDIYPKWKHLFETAYQTALKEQKDVEEELAYAYIFAHIAKHYKGGGTGIRSIIDIYLITKHKKAIVSSVKFQNFLKEAGIYTFFLNMQKLTQVWFENKEGTEVLEKMSAYIIGSGLYGTTTQSVNNTLSNQVTVNGWKNRFQYMKGICFPNKKIILASFPFLENKGILIYFGYILRGLRVIFFRRKNMNLLKQAIVVSDDELKDLKEFHEAAGIILEDDRL